MARDTSYSYASLLVCWLLLASSLSAGPVPVETRDHANAASIPAATGVGTLPTPTTNATESTARASENETTRQPDEVMRQLGPVAVTIFLNCSLLEVEVEPATYEYVLALVYRDTTTGQRIPMLAGPFTGTVSDPFGETDFRLLEVQVRVHGLPPTGQFAPDRCGGPD